MAHGKWKETKLQPGTAGPGNMLGCSLVSFHFLWAILCPQAVIAVVRPRGNNKGRFCIHKKSILLRIAISQLQETLLTSRQMFPIFDIDFKKKRARFSLQILQKKVER